MILKLQKKNITNNAIIIFHDIGASSCDGPKNTKIYQYVCKNHKINMGWEFWYIIHKKYILKKNFNIFK